MVIVHDTVDVGTAPTERPPGEIHEQVVRFHSIQRLLHNQDGTGPLILTSNTEFLGSSFELKLHCTRFDIHHDLCRVTLVNTSVVHEAVQADLSIIDSDGLPVNDIPTYDPNETKIQNSIESSVYYWYTGMHERGFHLRLCTHRKGIIPTALVDGAVVVKIRVRTKGFGTPPSPKIFKPENPFFESIRTLFDNGDHADVTFEVENVLWGRKRPAPTIFRAHRAILKYGCVFLYDLCNSQSGEEAVIPISGVKPSIFRYVLEYIYGMNTPHFTFKKYCMPILEAADKFKVIFLKLKAEAWLVENTVLSIDNVFEMLEYADRFSLALLKERVVDFVMANKDQVLERSKKLSEVSSQFVAEVLTAAVNVSNGETDVPIHKMRVCQLRWLLYNHALDVDGPREAMIQRLKENESAPRRRFGAFICD